MMMGIVYDTKKDSRTSTSGGGGGGSNISLPKCLKSASRYRPPHPLTPQNIQFLKSLGLKVRGKH